MADNVPTFLASSDLLDAYFGRGYERTETLPNGDIIHIPVPMTLSVNSWVPCDTIPHKKPLIVIMVDNNE